jgi:tetratricopeptide (TPR) repeat protein
MDTNDFDASRHHKERSFELVRGICTSLQVEDERLDLAYAELGISRIQDARYAEGEEALKEAVRIRKSFGNYIPRSGEANLSYALVAQGKLEECNTLLLDSLAGRERALGKNDRQDARTGLILCALGDLRAAEGRLDESFEFHQKAWVHMRETVGDKDLYTARVAYKVARHMARMGKSEEAM